MKKFFLEAPITHIDPPLTKKTKDIDRKSIVAPFGAIISMQRGMYIRGIRMSKKKKYWCPMCQLMTTTPSGQERKVLTVVQNIKDVSQKEQLAKGLPDNTQKIHFSCTVCKRAFSIRQLRKIVTFLNQTTMVLSVGKRLINIMTFDTNFKLAGTKKINDAVRAMMVLWEDYFPLINDVWKFRPYQDRKTKKLLPPCKDAHFLFYHVMRNVDFQLGFPIDKTRLNDLMNREAYSDNVFISQCETTSATHVNIKMYTNKPKEFMYEVLCYKGGKSNVTPTFKYFRDKRYASIKPSKEKYNTFIIFSSAEIILTGRYEADMKRKYEFFVKTALANRKLIEERVEKPKMSFKDFMKKKRKDDE